MPVRGPWQGVPCHVTPRITRYLYTDENRHPFPHRASDAGATSPLRAAHRPEIPSKLGKWKGVAPVHVRVSLPSELLPADCHPREMWKPWVSVGTWYGMTKLPCRASAGGVEDPHACAMGIMQRPRFPRGPRPRGMRRILAVSRPRRRSLANLGAEEIRQNRDVVVAGGIRCGPTTNRPIGGVRLVPGFLPVPVLLVFLFGSVDGPPASRSGWPPTMAFFFLESQSNRAMR